MNPTRDVPVYLQLMQQLGLSPDSEKVSCNTRLRLGRSHGPRTIIPSTWELYKPHRDRERAESAVPMGPAHRDVRDGYLYGTLRRQRPYGCRGAHAALKYFAGGSYRNPAFAFYGNEAMCLTQKYEQQIDIIMADRFWREIGRGLNPPDLFCIVRRMKKDLHPESYRSVIFEDVTAGRRFLIGSTIESSRTDTWEDGKEYPLVQVEISSASHPFYTGHSKIVTLPAASRNSARACREVGPKADPPWAESRKSNRFANPCRKVFANSVLIPGPNVYHHCKDTLGDLNVSRARFAQTLRQEACYTFSMNETKLNPEDYADDHRVSYLVQEWKRLSQAEKDAQELIEVDPAMKELAEKELAEIDAQKQTLMEQMEKIVGGDSEREWPNEIVLEVRAGVGGEEASLFAEELAQMYVKYAHAKGWSAKALDESRAALGGYKEAQFEIKGPDCYRKAPVRNGRASRAARACDRKGRPHPHLDRVRRHFAHLQTLEDRNKSRRTLKLRPRAPAARADRTSTRSRRRCASSTSRPASTCAARRSAVRRRTRRRR